MKTGDREIFNQRSCTRKCVLLFFFLSSFFLCVDILSFFSLKKNDDSNVLYV